MEMLAGSTCKIERAVGKVRHQLRVHIEFPARDISREGRLRESLQSRQIDLIDREFGPGL